MWENTTTLLRYFFYRKIGVFLVRTVKHPTEGTGSKLDLWLGRQVTKKIPTGVESRPAGDRLFAAQEEVGAINLEACGNVRVFPRFEKWNCISFFKSTYFLTVPSDGLDWQMLCCNNPAPQSTDQYPPTEQDQITQPPEGPKRTSREPRSLFFFPLSKGNFCLIGENTSGRNRGPARSKKLVPITESLLSYLGWGFTMNWPLNI